MSTKATNPKDHVSSTRVPLWLLSPIAMAYWALAQLAGLIKYGAWNWRRDGARASTYVSAMRRHIDKWESGEELDAVDGTRHLGNVMACCSILLESQAAGKLVDDRPPSIDLTKVHAECEANAERLFRQYADRPPPSHATIADTPACFPEDAAKK